MGHGYVGIQGLRMGRVVDEGNGRRLGLYLSLGHGLAQLALLLEVSLKTVGAVARCRPVGPRFAHARVGGGLVGGAREGGAGPTPVVAMPPGNLLGDLEVFERVLDFPLGTAVDNGEGLGQAASPASSPCCWGLCWAVAGRRCRDDAWGISGKYPGDTILPLCVDVLGSLWQFEPLYRLERDFKGANWKI